MAAVLRADVCPCGGARPCQAHDLGAWYSPHAKQKPFHWSRARFRNVCAGRRGGKTIASAIEFLRSIYRDLGAGKIARTAPNGLPIFRRAPAARYWIVAPERSLYEQAWEYVVRALPMQTREGLHAEEFAGMRLAPEQRLWLPGNMLIECKSADRPLSLVSKGLHGVWLTEAARMKKTTWENVSPALADHTGWCLTDTTPLGRNWYYEEFWRRGTKGDKRYSPSYENFSWYTRDNTAAPDVIAESETARKQAEAAGGTLLAVYKREFEASFDAFAGQIYDLDPRAHVFAGPVHRSQYRETVGGFDWARAHAGCLLIAGVREDGGYDVVSETYEAGLLVQSWIGRMRAQVEQWKPETIYADPSSPNLPDYQNAGLPVEPALERDVLAGIERVAGLLARRGHDGKPMLRIHASCTNLLREMQGYRWKESPTGTSDMPVKVNDDAIDSCRYLVTSHFRGPAIWGIR